MKKRYYIIFISLALILIAAPFKRGVKYVSMTTLENAIQEFIEPNNLVKQDSETFSSQYHIKENEYEELLYYGPASYIDAEEITIIYAPNNPQIYDKCLTHINNQIKSFEGYGITQTQLLKNATVKQMGDYVILIVAKDSSAIFNTIQSQF